MTLTTFKATIAEALFVLLPLLVLTIVSLVRGVSMWQVASSPEWSFGASVLFGQAIVKTVAAAAHRGHLRWEPIALMSTVVIVLGLAPSLIVLAFMLSSEPAKTGLVWAQLGLFAIATLTFLLLGTVTSWALAQPEKS